MTTLELKPFFDLLYQKSKEWAPETIIPNIKELSNIIVPQLERLTEGKFRHDRNEALGFFDAIAQFSSTGLLLSLEHFQSLIKNYAQRIKPYPHYSGIKIELPVEFK
ncbi:MAG: hypothetical protein OEZ01_04515 [Candidatus Heimdallarchaeota archaeon]|nr:hypothetical protein [Candidatus Heimdallarchaeota archaeon]MDH5645243.1 hypothetical protein [Candidatus Heimdallarchaeota archaeon]